MVPDRFTATRLDPARYRALFVGHEHLLPTHRGWDPGALLLGREMAKRFGAPLYYDETTRLLDHGRPEIAYCYDYQ